MATIWLYRIDLSSIKCARKIDTRWYKIPSPSCYPDRFSLLEVEYSICMIIDIDEKLRKICHARKTQRRNARGDTFIFGSKDLGAFRTTFLAPLYQIYDNNRSTKCRRIGIVSTIAHANMTLPRNRRVTWAYDIPYMYLKIIEVPSTVDKMIFLGLNPHYYTQHLVHPMAEHHEAYILLISCW